MMISLALPDRRDLRVDLYPRVTGKIHVSKSCIEISICSVSGSVPFPDFITSANLELMLLASFLLFFWGAIVMDFGRERRSCDLIDAVAEDTLSSQKFVGLQFSFRMHQFPVGQGSTTLRQSTQTCRFGKP